jgi:hypothetical protein
MSGSWKQSVNSYNADFPGSARADGNAGLGANARFQNPSLTPPRDVRPSAGASAFRPAGCADRSLLRRSGVRTFCSTVSAASSGVNPAGATVRLASTSLLAKVSSRRNPLCICRRPTHESPFVPAYPLGSARAAWECRLLPLLEAIVVRDSDRRRQLPRYLHSGTIFLQLGNLVD